LSSKGNIFAQFPKNLCRRNANYGIVGKLNELEIERSGLFSILMIKATVILALVKHSLDLFECPYMSI
jgi:hypothetical protein